MYSDDITNINKQKLFFQCFLRLLSTGKPRQSGAPQSRLQSLLLRSYGMPRPLPEMVKLKIVRALFICQNWPPGPLPDQKVWKWNRLFPRVFAEKPSPWCIRFGIWLIWLESWLKRKFSLRREWSGWSVLTNEKRLKLPSIACRWCCLLRTHT